MYGDTRYQTQSRVELSERVVDRFFRDIYRGKLSKLANDIGLSYTLLYNLVKGRIRSLSARDYRIIFGEDPPKRENVRVEGSFFRGMARLWLYLNDDVSCAELYREYYPHKNLKRVDYRIFTGEVKTVERRIERLMEEKFLDQGFDRAEIKRWIEDLDAIGEERRIPYGKVKPVLEYLERNLKVKPSCLLHQFSMRYDSGELKTVSEQVFSNAKGFKEKTESALRAGSKFALEKIRAEVYGEREGMTLYADVEGELKLLKKYGKRSPKRYLGRSLSHYEKGDLKRISSWRAKKIHEDFLKLIEKLPKMPILFLHGSHLARKVNALSSVLKAVIVMRMIEDETRTYERAVLIGQKTAAYPRNRFDAVPVGKAAYFVGMTEKAFDLMIARNSDIFRGLVIRSDGKWYLPGLYLEELSEKDGFAFVRGKYELLARR